MDYQAINEFWFQELKPKQWFIKDPKLDQIITERFRAVHDAAGRGELFPWRDTAEGRLAEIIIERFGRYPHRNAILGRPSSPEETAFLAQPGSSF